ncbi:MAG: hypothetical protein PF450_15580 [Bacteroidales bacterium]|jgi:hypothetical protein|nr:hypothetical protein [Bacteroidales bacterium]
MKKILSLAFSILIASSLSSQTIVENPSHGVITMSGVRIDKVELGDEFTILHFTSFAENDKTFIVPENLSIMSLYDWKVDSVIRAEGIELGEPFFVPKSGEVKWKAFFPALSDSTRVFDLGTFWGSGSWLIYEIQIKEPVFPFYIPKEIQGHWVNNTNGDWEIGVLDTIVVHDQQVWTITDFHKEEGQVIIHVKKDQH